MATLASSNKQGKAVKKRRVTAGLEARVSRRHAMLNEGKRRSSLIASGVLCHWSA